MPGFLVHHQLLELAQIESVMPSNYLIGHLPTWGVHLSVSYLFAFSYCLWGSQGKNTEVMPFPSPVDHILSDLSTMTCPSSVALHSMAHSFIELEQAVVHVISLVSFL